MLDDELDHIIREAAENHHPPYNDKAWEKMHLKLEKHLPQKTDRRKLIFFLLFFMLLGGAFFFTVNRFNGNNNSVSEKMTKKGNSDQLMAESLVQKSDIDKYKEGDNENSNGNKIARITINPDNNNPSTQPDNHTEKIEENSKINNLNNYNTKTTTGGKRKTNDHIVSVKPYAGSQAEDEVRAGNKSRNKKTAGKININITAGTPEKNDDESIVSSSTGIKNQEVKKPEINAKAEPEKELTKIDKIEKEKELILKSNKPLTASDTKKSKKNFPGNFGLTFSVGPDISFIKLNKLGKITLTYGAGLTYSFAQRFTARAGLYFSKKIYVAIPEEYHAVTYPNLTTIDADCKILEIPIGLSYNFRQRNKHNWFSGVGLSSFIMKNEGYKYNYKTSTGQTYNYYKEINNQNKHYFSVLTFSGGYNYRLNKRVSIQAEPYLKIPLSGVGLGKMNLKSTGILFTLTVKPFARGK